MIGDIAPHVTGGWLQHAWWWIEIHTGTQNESGPYYGFWSGFGSDVGEVTLIAALIGVIKANNCQQKGCWRLGAHPVNRPDGTPTPFKVCKTHHPRVNHKERVTAATIYEAATTPIADAPTVHTGME